MSQFMYLLIKQSFSVSPGDIAIKLIACARQAHLLYKATTADFLIGCCMHRQTHTHTHQRIQRVVLSTCGKKQQCLKNTLRKKLINGLYQCWESANTTLGDGLLTLKNHEVTITSHFMPKYGQIRSTNLLLPFLP